MSNLEAITLRKMSQQNRDSVSAYEHRNQNQQRAAPSEFRDSYFKVSFIIDATNQQILHHHVGE
jgi:hypothetical protein